MNKRILCKVNDKDKKKRVKAEFEHVVMFQEQGPGTIALID